MIAFVLLGVFLGFPVLAEEPLLLRYGYPKLDRQSLRFRRQINTRSLRGGAEFSRSETILLLRRSLRWYGRRASLRESVERIDAALGNKTGTLRWTSARPKEGSQELRRRIAPELARRPLVLVTDYGKVLDTPEEKDPERRSASIEAQRSLLLELPLKAVAPGHAWSVEARKSAGRAGEFVTRIVYRFVRIAQRDGRRSAEISLAIFTRLDRSKSTLPRAQSVRVDETLSRGKGLLILDLERGVLLSRKQSSRLIVITKDGLGERRSETRFETSEELLEIVKTPVPKSSD